MFCLSIHTTHTVHLNDIGFKIKHFCLFINVKMSKDIDKEESGRWCKHTIHDIYSLVVVCINIVRYQQSFMYIIYFFNNI